MESINSTTFRSGDVGEDDGMEIQSVIEVVAFSVLNIIIGLMGTLGNITLIAVMIYNPLLRTPSSRLYWSLSIADLISCSCQETLIIYRAIANGNVSNVYNLVTSGIGISSSLSSFLHLFFMSLDRYLCIFESLRYPIIVTSSRIYICISFSWFFSVFLAPFIILKMTIGSALTSSICIVVICVTVFLQLKIFLIARKHERQIRDVQSRFGASHNPLGHSSVRRRNKAAKTVGIMVGCYALCWLPMFIVAPNISMPKDWKVFNWLYFLLCINATLNPYLYILRTAVIKSASFTLIGMTCSCPRIRRDSFEANS